MAQTFVNCKLVPGTPLKDTPKTLWFEDGIFCQSDDILTYLTLEQMIFKANRKYQEYWQKFQL